LCQLVREEVNLRGDLRCAFGVGPAFSLVELFAQVGESLAVRGFGLGVEELAGLTESELARGVGCMVEPSGDSFSA
jgi:hypothetical protein